MSSKAQQLIASKEAWNELNSSKEHAQLHVSIRNHLYELYEQRKKKRKGKTAKHDNSNNDNASSRNNN